MSKCIEWAEKRLNDENYKEEWSYWSAYLDGAKAQDMELSMEQEG